MDRKLAAARLHAHLVFGRASWAGVVLHAGFLLIGAHLAARLSMGKRRHCNKTCGQGQGQHKLRHQDFLSSKLGREAIRHPDQLLLLAVLSSAARNSFASFSASSLAQKWQKRNRGCSSSMWLCSAVTSI